MKMYVVEYYEFGADIEPEQKQFSIYDKAMDFIEYVSAINRQWENKKPIKLYETTELLIKYEEK